MKFSYAWGMPSGDTFDCAPIGNWVRSWVERVGGASVDPFARNKQIADFCNDINPHTSAPYHMDAEDFLSKIPDGLFDLAIMDPPYSPRQIAECYREAGLPVTMQATQNGALYARTRAALVRVLAPGAVVLSFGWNSCGMGKKYGAIKEELLLVAHGGAHNDTICLAERMPDALPEGEQG